MLFNSAVVKDTSYPFVMPVIVLIVVEPNLITRVSEKLLEYFVIGILIAFPIVKLEIVPNALFLGIVFNVPVPLPDIVPTELPLYVIANSWLNE